MIKVANTLAVISTARRRFSASLALIVLLAATLSATLVANNAMAVIETYEFSDPSLEARYHVLSQELRCPKCQNQNIADSNAPISKDLRALLHKQLEAGASDEEILSFMVARYGEFVRYRPAVDQKTAVLWYTPMILTVLGFLGLAVHLSRRKRVAASTAPSEAELSKLREALDDSNAVQTSETPQTTHSDDNSQR